MALCPKCEAAVRARHQSKGSGSPSNQPSGQLGAIRPALKVVHLKPGEEPPQRAAESDSSTATFSAENRHSASPESVSAPRRERPALKPAGSKTPANVLFIGFLLLTLAAWCTVWLMRSGSLPDIFQKEQPPDEQTNFAHIVIHERKEVVVDGKNVIGSFTVDGETAALERVEALYTPEKHLVELKYYSKEGPPPAETTSGSPTPTPYAADQPLVHVYLQFAPLKERLDRDQLQNYMVEYLGVNPPFKILNSYRRHLAAFGEVSPLSGALKQGELVRGEMTNHRTVLSKGKEYQTSWTLTFEAPLQILK
jgi:hypothetical protein